MQETTINQNESSMDEDIELHLKYITQKLEKDDLLEHLMDKKLIKKIEFTIKNPLPIVARSNKYVTIQNKNIEIEEKDNIININNIHIDKEEKI